MHNSYVFRVNYQAALRCRHVLSFALSCESCSVLPLVCVQRLIPWLLPSPIWSMVWLLTSDGWDPHVMNLIVSAFFWKCLNFSQEAHYWRIWIWDLNSTKFEIFKFRKKIWKKFRMLIMIIYASVQNLSVKYCVV